MLVFEALMICSFRDKLTEAVALKRNPKGFPPDVLHRAIRKLTMIASASTLNDLRAPPSNRLEALQGNRKGQYSIRINDQWRICFTWTNEGAAQVEIADYH
jgi:proteic killer suppression protein